MKEMLACVRHSLKFTNKINIASYSSSNTFSFVLNRNKSKGCFSLLINSSPVTQRYLSSQVKPNYSINSKNNLEDKETIQHGINKNDKVKHPIVELTKKNSDNSDRIKKSEEEPVAINLNKDDLDEKRKEIGFETESLIDSEWKEIKIEYNKLLFNYSKLSKKNLTALVVATTMIGCVMAPVPFNPYLFTITTLGTTLTSSSANTFNQFLEVPYDSQMNRTKDRVLVRGNLTPLHAFTFASACGIAGVSTLYFLVNPLTAALGASTLFLYTMIYTPMKRLSALNTWVGSIVGAIPPLMGYTAVMGQIEPAGLLLAAILYSWQFPHFHALSWNLRSEYSRAGYRMIAVLNPRICTSSSLSHTIALTLMCSYLAPILELTTWNFAIDSLPLNFYFMYLAIQFKRKEDANSSRKLFRFSLAYLPILMLIMLMTKHPIKNDENLIDEGKNLNNNFKKVNLT